MRYEWYKKGRELLDEISAVSLPDTMAAVWYVGQEGIIIKWNKLTIGVDLVLNDLCRADGASRRNYDIPFQPEELTGIDYFLGTHNHADHINLSTLRPLADANPQLRVIVPEPVRRELIAGGMREESLIGARADETLYLTGSAKPSAQAVLHPVAAPHEEYVTDEEGNQKNLGYVLELGAIRLFHAGDAVVTPRLIRDVSRWSPLALAFVPVNGADTERHGRGIIGNMDCRDAAYFAQQIQADMTVPMHYDMVQGNEEDALIFAGYMQRLYPGRKYHIMQLGEKIII